MNPDATYRIATYEADDRSDLVIVSGPLQFEDNDKDALQNELMKPEYEPGKYALLLETRLFGEKYVHTPAAHGVHIMRDFGPTIDE